MYRIPPVACDYPDYAMKWLGLKHKQWSQEGAKFNKRLMTPLRPCQGWWIDTQEVPLMVRTYSTDIVAFQGPLPLYLMKRRVETAV